MMTDPRIVTTSEAARRMGFIKKDGMPHCARFLAWTRERGLTPFSGKSHHLWWDYKAIEQCLDKLSDIKPESVDWDNVLLKRLANNGDIQNEIRR